MSAITRGQLADACVIATGNAEGPDLQTALGLVGKRGRVTVTALGMLKLDELITREYTLEQINEGYEDMRAGRNIRGLIRY